MASADLQMADVGGVLVGYWNPSRQGRNVDNFGDVMGPALAARLVARLGLSQRQMCPWTLLCQGSTVHLAGPRTVLWGTGVNGKMLASLRSVPKDLHAVSVRGPWSRRALQATGVNVPPVYGDPALLTRMLYPELEMYSAMASGYTFVPNFNDLHVVEQEASELGLSVIDPRMNVDLVLRAIARSEMVIASSLHAGVVADSLGIPCRFVSSATEGVFKFRDYLAGTGRQHVKIARSLDEALELGPHVAPEFDPESLLEAFPKWLWDEASVTDSREEQRLTPHAQIQENEWLGWWESYSIDGEENASKIYSRSIMTLIESWPEMDARKKLFESAKLIRQRLWLYSEVKLAATSIDVESVDYSCRQGGATEVMATLDAISQGAFAEVRSTFQGKRESLLRVIIHWPWPQMPPNRLLIGWDDGEEVSAEIAKPPTGRVCLSYDIDLISKRRLSDSVLAPTASVSMLGDQNQEQWTEVPVRSRA